MKRVVALFMSFLLLLSSSGIAYAQHFCGEFEMMAQITLGEKHLSCGMAMPMTSCDSEEMEDHGCCDNEYTQVETDDTFAKVSFEFNFDLDFIPAPVSNFYTAEVIKLPRDNTSYFQYRPPPPKENIWVLYETFLI
ncbi:MAG: hypothetical protein HKN48_08660 [Flavobacteriaceae bacterium]|nr:hypothetical protein [Flavobacteriaceae bacterium]